MDKLVPFYYKEYGEYVNQSRAFPMSLDGLKPVERRILLSTYEIAREKFVKSAKVDGHCIGHYHPHGSSYSTIVQLVNRGFLEGQGNFGVDVGIESSPAAAMRYTECRLGREMSSMIFKLIDYVPRQESELDKEPPYLPTMYPLCLIGNSFEFVVGIGFGYKCLIPSYTLEDLNKRLMFLLGYTKEEPIIRPVTDCKILSKDDELKNLLITGKGSIRMKGIYKVDGVHSKIFIKSWPYGKRFDSILNKLSAELNNQDIGFADLSTDKTNIVLEVIKQRSKAEILERVAKKLDDALEGSVPFETIVTDENRKIKYTSVDELLTTTYAMFKHTNEIMLHSQIKDVQESIQENNLLEKIKPSLQKHLKDKAQNPDEVIIAISKETAIDEEIVRTLLNKYRISKLLTVNTDISVLLHKKDNLNVCLQDLDNFVVSQYKLKK